MPMAVLAAVGVAIAMAGSCRSVPRAMPARPPSLPQPTLASWVSPPILRVGILTAVQRASVAADSGLIVWGEPADAGGPRRIAVQRATFVPVAPTVSSRSYRVQVGSLADERAARELASRAQAASGQPGSVRWSAETRTHQVRVGAAAAREEAIELARQLGRAGIPGGWVVEEESAPVGGRVRLLETGDELQVATLFPNRVEESLGVDGVTYRGLVEVRPGDPSGVTVVNVVNLEDYLRGVVPNELSPTVFPQLEAHKAQAVAARTYALRNRGQFRAKGYDICATPACQVYRGRSSEHALSDRAVEETRGIAALHRGAPINALYTSTCGGHTEEGANIFEGEAVPYLRGVACTPERVAWSRVRAPSASRRAVAAGTNGGPRPATGRDAEPRPAGMTAEAGGELARDVALLAVLGVVEPRQASSSPRAIPSEDEVRGWLRKLAAASGRKPCGGTAPDPPVVRRGSFFGHLVHALCWEERGRRLLAPGDADYLLQVEDRGDLAGDRERLSAALLMQEAVLSPYADNTLRVNAALTRGEALVMLARALEKAGPPGLVAAEFRSATDAGVTVKRREVVESHALDPSVRLFRALNGTRQAVSELTVMAGEKVRFVLRDGRVAFLEAEQSRLGAAADRTSRYYRWEVRLTPEDVAAAVARYGDVGAVKDVVPLRLGVSGRVVELAVVGSLGELVLKGLRVRWGLGLRENLFVIDRETDGTGNVRRFVFTGKGWGHGVGLCQVGASGMAVAGATYETILGHYYTGITLQSTR